ncbi:MAG: hypothetical protein IPK87_17070 [Planctomycetes bacterium]|nr:hypothetical protein [Planctomycetota bacterium]
MQYIYGKGMGSLVHELATNGVTTIHRFRHEDQAGAVTGSAAQRRCLSPLSFANAAGETKRNPESRTVKASTSSLTPFPTPRTKIFRRQGDSIMNTPLLIVAFLILLPMPFLHAEELAEESWAVVQNKPDATQLMNRKRVKLYAVEWAVLFNAIDLTSRDSVTDLWLCDCSVPDAPAAWAEDLTRFKSLRRLIIDRVRQVTSLHLRNLRGASVPVEIEVRTQANFDSSWLEAFADLSQLERLECWYCADIDRKAFCGLKGLRNLKRLLLADVITLPDSFNLWLPQQGLRELELRGSFQLDEEEIEVLAGAPQLVSLALKGGRIGDAHLIHLEGGKLRSLALTLGSSVTESALSRLIKSLSLTHLELHNSVNLTGELFDDLGKSMACESIVFTSLPAITTSKLAGLEKLQRLRRLEVSGPSLANDALIAIASRLPKLETLRMLEASAATVQGLLIIGNLKVVTKVFVSGLSHVNAAELNSVRAKISEAFGDRPVDLTLNR